MKKQNKSGRGNRGPELLRAARQLFFERGYHGTTMERVARSAGFSKRTVYIYFKNKDELFLTIGAEGMNLLREKFESLHTGDMDIEEAIRAILGVYLDFARRHPQYFRIIFQEATAEMVGNIPGELRRRLEEQERSCLNVVVSVVKKAQADGLITGIDPWEMAAAFWGAATGIIQLSMGGSQTVFTRSSREELAAKAVLLLYEGAKKT